jgi:hypothetical protein
MAMVAVAGLRPDADAVRGLALAPRRRVAFAFAGVALLALCALFLFLTYAMRR